MKKSALFLFVALFIIMAINGICTIYAATSDADNEPIVSIINTTEYTEGTVSTVPEITISNIECNKPDKFNNELIIDDQDAYIKNPIEHIVEPGDVLWNLSKYYYGDGNYYKAVMLYNDIMNEDLIVGQTIIFPNIEDSEFVKYIELAENGVNSIIYAGSNDGYKYGRRLNPAVDIYPTGYGRNNIGYVDTSSFTYIGEYRITGYTPGCVHCCGNSRGITAAGTEAISGYTVATASHLKFGTTLYIEGYGFYVVEDRGNLGDRTVDIAADTHSQCYDLTGRANVYIVREGP